MPHGKLLTDFEKGQISAFAADGVHVAEIANRLGRSRKVVYNFLENPQNYGKNHKGGRQRKLTTRDERHVQRLASNSRNSAAAIGREVQSDASRWTIRRAILRADHLVHSKLQHKPRLTDMHKNARCEWAANCVRNRTDWQTVIFSDEKRFCLDGPDGYGYYWHDLRKEPLTMMSRIQGGGGVMIWSCSGYNGVRFEVVKGKMNAESYVEVLEQQLLPFVEELGGPNWIFQQDNAPIHTANETMECFATHHFFEDERHSRLLAWPSLSPDLNPQENVWGVIVRDVYAGGRQFNHVRELQEAIAVAFSRIDMTGIQHLIDGMPNRVLQVVARKGSYTHY
jgi:transposase